MSLKNRFVASRSAAPQAQRQPLNRVVSASQARGLAAESSTFGFLCFAASEQVTALTEQAKNKDAANTIASQDFDMCFSIIEDAQETFASSTTSVFDTATVFQSLIDALSEIDSELQSRRENFTFAQSLRIARTLIQSLLSSVQSAQQRFAAEQRSEATPAPSPSGGWGKAAADGPLPDTFDGPPPAPAKAVKRKAGLSLLD